MHTSASPSTTAYKTMATKTEDRKIYEPEYLEETPLPEAVIWENIVDAPQTLADLSSVDGGRLDTVEAEVATGFADIAIQGWMFDGAFSATDHDTVAWAAGTIRFKDGVNYSIAGGNTGNMAAITYIYFDLAVSTTAFQTTTTAANAVGVNKLLIAVAQNVASGKDATFQAFGGKGGVGVLLTADNIAANTITANELFINTLSSISADIGTITAGSISGVTITGGLFRTATSGQRIEMSTSAAANEIRFYNSSTLYGILQVTSSGSEGQIKLVSDSDGGGFILDTGVGASGFSGSSIVSNGGGFSTSGNASNGFNTIDGKFGGYLGVFGTGGGGPDYISTDLKIDSSWTPTVSATYDLGTTSLRWRDGWFSRDLTVGDDLTVVDDFTYQGFIQPVMHFGYVNSGATMGTNPSGFSVSSSATGVYTVTHNLGTTSYSVICTPRASVVKNITVSVRDTNSFTVRISNLSDVLEDNDFMFVLAKSA